MADIAVTAANVRNYGASMIHGTLGTTVTAGQVVYQDPADGKYKLADTNGASAPIRTPAGIALNGGGDGQPVAIATGGGLLDLGATLAVGHVYVLSATAGGIAPVADLATGHYTVVLGVATATNRLRMSMIAADGPRV
jgi:hypothetical protein